MKNSAKPTRGTISVEYHAWPASGFLALFVASISRIIAFDVSFSSPFPSFAFFFENRRFPPSRRKSDSRISFYLHPLGEKTFSAFVNSEKIANRYNNCAWSSDKASKRPWMSLVNEARRLPIISTSDTQSKAPLAFRLQRDVVTLTYLTWQNRSVPRDRQF